MTRNNQQHKIVCDRLPLAIYREVATHLRQVPGVEAGLLPQTSTQFDYLASQIGGLWYQLPDDPTDDPSSQQRVQQILSYYSDRFGDWRTLSPTS